MSQDIENASSAANVVTVLRQVAEKNSSASSELFIEHANAALHSLIRLSSSPTHGDDNIKIVGRIGGIAYLGMILESFSSNREVMWRGLHASSHLSADSSKREKMGIAGFSAVLAGAMKLYGEHEDSEIIEFTLKTLKLFCSEHQIKTGFYFDLFSNSSRVKMPKFENHSTLNTQSPNVTGYGKIMVAQV